MIGAGIAWAPEYLGSDEHRTSPAPVVRVRFHDSPFYFGNVPGGAPLQVGFAYSTASDWSLGLSLSGQPLAPRDVSRDQYLAGLDDIDETVLAGGFLVFHRGRFSLALRSESDIADQDQGTLINLEARTQRRLGDRWLLSLGPSLTWGNRQHMETFFGVDRSTNPGTALPAYEADAGLQEIAASIGLNYLLSAHWMLGTALKITRLQSEASDSPIVQEDQQLGASLFAAYRF